MSTLSTDGILPYLAVSDADRAIALYVDVFGMTDLYRLAWEGRIGHAELELNGGRLLISDEFPEAEVRGPTHYEGTPVSLLLYVADVNATARKAVAAGFKQQGDIKDEFFGDRVVKLVDPFGHRWFVHQRLEDVSVDEIKRRAGVA